MTTTQEDLGWSGMTPENVRSWAIMTTLCRHREWLTSGDVVNLGKDSCILSTRIVLEVARYFGLPKARPVPVSACVFNAEGFAAYQGWHALPEAEQAARGFELPEGGWAVAIDGTDLDKFSKGTVGGRWSGHLIAQVQDLFVDFSLDQFSRPAKGMEVEAAVFPVQDIWDDHGVAVYKRDDGVAIVYRSMDNARGFTRAPDWTDVDRYRDVIGMLINRVKEDLGV